MSCSGSRAEPGRALAGAPCGGHWRGKVPCPTFPVSVPRPSEQLHVPVSLWAGRRALPAMQRARVCCELGFSSQSPAEQRWRVAGWEPACPRSPLVSYYGILPREAPGAQAPPPPPPLSPPPAPSPLLPTPSCLMLSERSRSGDCNELILFCVQPHQWPGCAALAGSRTPARALSPPGPPSLRSFSAIFLLFMCIFRSMFSLVCFSNLLRTLCEPARWIIFFLDS